MLRPKLSALCPLLSALCSPSESQCPLHKVSKSLHVRVLIWKCARVFAFKVVAVLFKSIIDKILVVEDVGDADIEGEEPILYQPISFP